MEPGSTHLPLLQRFIDLFYVFPGVPLRYTPGFYQARLRRLRAHIIVRPPSKTGLNPSRKPSLTPLILAPFTADPSGAARRPRPVLQIFERRHSYFRIGL